MTTHTISYFKNHALQLLDDVATKGDELVITRRGKPLAQIGPVKTSAVVQLGKLKGTLAIEGDIVGPLGDADWAASQ